MYYFKKHEMSLNVILAYLFFLVRRLARQEKRKVDS